jgi:hypothetical protein
VPRSRELPLESADNQFLRSSQHDYTLLACPEKATGESTIQLLPKVKMTSVPKDKSVTAATPAATGTFGITQVSGFSGLNDYTCYTQV